MKINVNNRDKLNAALAEVNGRAQTHTANATSVQVMADDAERALEKFGLQKGSRRGAVAYAVSGGSLPNAYGHKAYSVNVTRVKLERGSRDWFMVNAERDAVDPTASRNVAVRLSDNQVRLATERRMRDLHISVA